MRSRRGYHGGALVAAALLAAVASCAQPAADTAPSAASPLDAAEASTSGGAGAETDATDATPSASAESSLVDPTGDLTAGAIPTEPASSPPPLPVERYAVEAPGPLTDDLVFPDLLVYSPTQIDEEVVRRIRRLAGVDEVERFGLAQVAVQDRVLDVAAVDPSTYRRFNPPSAAREIEVWARVAGGEVSILQKLGQRLQDENGYLRLGNDQDAAVVHIGAYAPQVRRVDLVVNTAWGAEQGIPDGNALLVNTGRVAPQKVRPEIQEILGEGVSVQLLGPDLDITVQQTAFLTGGSVAAAVGSFSYTVLGGGRIAPDPAWVRANIRTEEVPILGRVTCHKVMLPQMRAALTEIVSRGLADKIHPDEYAGCYYPRFIAGTTSLSLHSFGIAFDINVPGNLRGTEGEIDRTVVSIFKRWGFAWGGDWNYTDPMHFEMDALVEAR